MERSRTNEIKKTIQDNYEKFGTYDPFTLAKFLGIRIEYGDFNRRPLGKAVYHKYLTIIMLDISIKGNSEEFFVCAHELCHVLLHSELKTHYGENQFAKINMEIEADFYASELVFESFKHNYGKTPQTIRDLMIYGVPGKLVENFF